MEHTVEHRDARARFADLIGVPYRPRAFARLRPGDPLDCYGLVREALMRLGVELPARPDELMGEQWREWARPMDPLGTGRLGDVVLIRLKVGVGGWNDHLGFCLGPDEFLHTAEGIGSRVERLSVWVRAGLVVGRYRPIALGEGGGG